MTTIIPDTSTEEGQKLLQYQPGDKVTLEITVGSVSGNKMMAEVTKCEPSDQEEADEAADTGGEGEYGAQGGAGGMAGHMAAMHKGVPPAVVIALGHGGPK